MLTQSPAVEIRAQLRKNTWRKIRDMYYDELHAERRLLLALLHYEALLDDETMRFDAIKRELERRDELFDANRGELTTAAVFYLGAHHRNIWGIDFESYL